MDKSNNPEPLQDIGGEGQETITQVGAGRRFGVSAKTISRWEKLGLIKGKRVGGVKLYPLEQLRRVVGIESKQKSSE